MTAQYLIPQALLEQLAQVAAQAPVPYAQTQAMWAAVARLEPRAPEAPAEEQAAP